MLICIFMHLFMHKIINIHI
ncbi:MAG: hypothetical protein J6A93_02100 [Ruminococcus sp.]|nr:hypothetical protein [Ruminococcus sp.]